MADPSDGATTRDEIARRMLRGTGWLSIIAVVIPLLATIVVCTRGAPALAGAARAAAAGLILGLAPFALGALFGFIFGIPRTVQDPPRAGGSPPEGTAEAKEKIERGIRYLINENIGQMSDWLTKILVGLGLSQLSAIPERVHRAARYVSPVLGGGPDADARAAVIIVYFLICGFFVGYLATRLVLTWLFTVVDPTVAGPNPESVNRIFGLDLRVARVGSGAPNVASKDKAEVLRFGIEQLRDPKELGAWGIAKLADNDPNAAVEALQRAYVTGAGNPDERRRLTEGLIMAALYEPAPAGFRRAISVGEMYNASTEAKNANVWAWLACAYGQAYQWEMTKGADPRQLAELRDKALAAVRSTLEIDDEWKPVLADTMKPGSADNDLLAFADDAEFKALLLS